MNSGAASVDSSPKWFTEVELDFEQHWSESVIEYVPQMHFDDSAFTRVVIAPAQPGVIPYAISGV